MSGRLNYFFLIAVICMVFLSTGYSVAQNVFNKDNRDIFLAQGSTPGNQEELTDDDLGDFFENDIKQMPEDTDSEDLDTFFSDDDKPPDTPEILDSHNETDKKGYFFKGNIGLKTGFRFNYDPKGTGSTDHSGLSDAKVEIDLEFGSKVFGSWDFFMSGSAFYNFAYKLNNRDDYIQTFLDDNEKELELEKLFVRGSLNRALDIKIGRQIVVWGKSDNIRITDILNPLDLREPGMTDIEDLRLPVFMTRLDYYLFNLSVSAYLIHEHRLSKLPVFGSPYYSLPLALPDESDISARINNTEYAVSLSATFPSFDISFYLADIYDDSSYLNTKNQRLNGRVSMVGVAANKAHGNFLYKVETALFDNIRFSAFPKNGRLVDNLTDYTRVDFLGGVEYSGFQNSHIGFEMADKWLTNYDLGAEAIGKKEHTIQYALRVSRTFLNDVLEMTLLTSLFGKSANDGGFIRTQAEYDLSDEIALTLGAIFYKSGSSVVLSQIGGNDVIFTSIIYSF